jgi:hypothetical protein
VEQADCEKAITYIKAKATNAGGGGDDILFFDRDGRDLEAWAANLTDGRRLS